VRFVLAVLLYLAGCSAVLACASGTSLLDGTLATNPKMFGDNDVSSYQSGGDLVMAAPEDNIYVSYIGQQPVNLNLCADIRSVDPVPGSYAGLVFWRLDQNTFHDVVVRPDGTVSVVAVTKGNGTRLLDTSVPGFKGGPGTIVSLEVDVIGPHVNISINGVNAGSINDFTVPTNSRSFGLLTGSPKEKRSIYAFSNFSATSNDGPAIAAPQTPPAAQNEDAVATPGDPSLSPPDLQVYKGLIEHGLGPSFIPDGYSVVSVTPNVKPKYGAAEVVFQLASGKTHCELIYRFYQREEEATDYVSQESVEGYTGEATQRGDLTTFGHGTMEDGDLNVQWVWKMQPDLGREWARVVSKSKNLVVLATITKPRPRVKAHDKISEGTIQETAAALEEAVLYKDALTLEVATAPK
jgi:hypothetical protein